MKTNYHTHTFLCGHASGTVEDYIKEAINQNFDEIGMTDHIPFPEAIHERNSTMRMGMEDFDGYLKDIEECKIKYADKIKIYSGFESEYIKEADDKGYYKQVLTKADFLIFGQHFIPDKNEKVSVFMLEKGEHILKYADIVEQGLATGYFSMLAHPDVFCNSYRNWDHFCEQASIKILKACEKYNTPIEINGGGLRYKKTMTPQGERFRYPRKEFWELAKNYDVKIYYNSDCHNPKSLVDSSYDKAKEFIKELGLEIQEKLPLKNKFKPSEKI